MKNKIEFIAFDADDTLWENELYFQELEHKFCHLLRKYSPAPFRIRRIVQDRNKKSAYLWLWTERNAALHD